MTNQGNEYDPVAAARGEQVYIEGTGYQDPPADRPPRRASASIGRRQKFDSMTGLKHKR